MQTKPILAGLAGERCKGGHLGAPGSLRGGEGFSTGSWVGAVRALVGGRLSSAGGG